MSYRSFKRVLGETSLERKCRFLFGACLLLLITGSFWWYGKQTEKLVHKQDPEKGRLLVDTVWTLIHWQELETNKEFKEAIAALSQELQQRDFKHRFIGQVRHGDFIVPPENEFEKNLLETFRRGGPGKPQEYDEDYSPDADYYRYYQPIYAKSNCLVGCHQPAVGAGGYEAGVARGGVGGVGFSYGRATEAGDLIAVARIDINNKPMVGDLTKNRAILISTAFITVFLAMVASYVIVRYIIVKPLKHLRDVSDAVSRGNIEQRAEIHTADEFEELGVAFNRMLRHMVAAQEELRDVNADLDGKVDELAQMNMRLFEMNRLKSDFLATMSHELRTPLNSIIGFSDVLGSIDSLDEKQQRYVQNIQKSGKMLLDMINDILDLAKIESGKMEVRLSDFAIEHVVATQCDMARPLTERKNIDLDIEIAPRLAPLHQDQAKVQQILNNLLSNAIKFTPEGGRIVVTAKREPISGDLLLVVADTGVGIAEEDQQSIFEKFRQGHTAIPGGDAMTREFSGTGLGLSIVKELCKLLGGEISLVSELGKGSVFGVRLPWTLTETPRHQPPSADSDETVGDRSALDRGGEDRGAADRGADFDRPYPLGSGVGRS
jgi:two-component system, NarL family, sensor histidine kinase BarA